MRKKYIYTVFAGSIYWKTFKNKKLAIKEATMLKKDGIKKVHINKEEDD